MGLLGLLFKFAVECFNLLAWPLFALGYPLYASIQAIETNSISDIRKLITYWICFSLILLFEHAFENLLEWLPYWPYIKLMIISCLVTPHFDGSFYVYKQLVHPFLSTNPCLVFNWLTKLLVLLEQDELFIKAKGEAKDMEPEAMENFIASKEPVRSEADPISHRQGRKPENVNDKKKANNQTSHNETRDLVDTGPALENKETGTQHADDAKMWVVGSVCLEMSSNMQDHTSHLQGRRHTEAAEKLKAKDQPQKSNISSPSAVTGAWTCVVCNVRATSKTDLISHFCGQRHAEALEQLKAKPNSNSSFEPWTCVICELKLNHVNNIIKHLEGKKHRNACNKLKWPKRTSKAEASSNLRREVNVVEVRNCKWWCKICKIRCTCEGNMEQHLNGSKHLAKTRELISGAAACGLA